MGNIDWKKWAKWLAIALVVYLIYRVISNRLESPKSTVVVPNPATGGTSTVPAAFKYDYSKVKATKPFGSGTNNSQEVAYFQRWLNYYYNTGLNVDGDWGAKTTLAVTLHRPTTNQTSTTLDSMGIYGDANVA